MRGIVQSSFLRINLHWEPFVFGPKGLHTEYAKYTHLGKEKRFATETQVTYLHWPWTQ